MQEMASQHVRSLPLLERYESFVHFAKGKEERKKIILNGGVGMGGGGQTKDGLGGEG